MVGCLGILSPSGSRSTGSAAADAPAFMTLPDPDELRLRLRSALAHTTPGDDAEISLGGLSKAETQRLRHLLPESLKPAAVLVPILDRPEGLSLLLTQRSAGLRHHAGQVAFPGGRVEASDRDAVATALREAEEEIGLRPERVEVLGCLNDHVILTGFRVTPVVAFIHTEAELALDPSEVHSVFEMPLAKALDFRRYHAKSWSHHGETVHFFELYHARRRVWGATAGMIASLARLLDIWQEPV
jgi:8-oxo-dGTP pyrophosphatase MutT (NUDIX family)